MFQKQHRLTEDEVERVKQIVLEILCDVSQVCQRHHIPYMLGGGTALGAVRHRGFIPWDDDIDINIPRKYIHEVCELIRREYPDKYEIDEPLYTKGYLSSFIQVHKKGTVFQEYLVQELEHCGIKIDIFPIENTYSNRLRRTIHGLQCEAGLLILSCYRMFAWRKEFFALAKGTPKATAVITLKALIGMLFAPAHEFWYAAIQKTLSKCTEEDSRYVVIPSGRKHFFGEIYNRKRYLKTIPMEFEGKRFPITEDYDVYLSRLYGNYMELPPEEKREHHVLYQLRF